MNLLEIEQRETLRREQVDERLHELADALARRNDVEFDRGGVHFRVKVPDEVRASVELEVEDDDTELAGRAQLVANRGATAPRDRHADRRSRGTALGSGALVPAAMTAMRVFRRSA